MDHNDLTIVSVYGHNTGSTAIPSILKSMQELPGSRGLLLSYNKPVDLPSDIEWQRIEHTNYMEYSPFMMHCLQSFIKTEYCLVVQDDFTPEQLTVGRNVSDYLKRIGVYGS